MDRTVFVGVALVAVFALTFTAASVDTNLDTFDPTPPSDPEIRSQETGAAGCVRNTTTDGAGGCTGSANGSGESLNLTSSDGAGEREATAGPARWQVAVSIALVTVGGILVLYGLTRGEDVTPETEGAGPDHSPGEGERLRYHVPSGVRPTNEIYRVWLGLRSETVPDRDGVSPATVAATAIEQGFDETAVRTICREFCAIRYGGAEPTEQRERRVRELGAQLGLTEGSDR